MFFEEGEEGLIGFEEIFALEAVAGVRECEEDGFDIGGEEALDHPDPLLVGDILVVGAVNDQCGGRRRGDPIEWAGFDVAFAGLLKVSSEPEGEDFVGVNALAIGVSEVAGTVNVDDAGDGG